MRPVCVKLHVIVTTGLWPVTQRVGPEFIIFGRRLCRQFSPPNKWCWIMWHWVKIPQPTINKKILKTLSAETLLPKTALTPVFTTLRPLFRGSFILLLIRFFKGSKWLQILLLKRTNFLRERFEDKIVWRSPKCHFVIEKSIDGIALNCCDQCRSQPTSADLQLRLIMEIKWLFSSILLNRAYLYLSWRQMARLGFFPTLPTELKRRGRMTWLTWSNNALLVEVVGCHFHQLLKTEFRWSVCIMRAWMLG